MAALIENHYHTNAWNLNKRTANSALVQTFNLNQLNELTSISRGGTLTVAGLAGEPSASVTVSWTEDKWSSRVGAHLTLG